MKMIHIDLPDSVGASLEGYILDCEITLGQEKARGLSPRQILRRHRA